MTNKRYAKSQALFERAQKVVPLASQTFSKSHLTYPQGQAPLFMDRAKGCRTWDVDGNEYIDFVNGLMPVILGYGDPDVDAAVTKQISRGVTFSLATELEVELAELLTEIIPCAEMVRYGKNGSDATSGAVRLARAYTGRDRVAACGYHGWQDWYIGTTPRNKGVPKAVRELTSRFPYNDLDALDKTLSAHPGEFACVIMEPMNSVEPGDGYLQGVKDIAHKHGALFVLDEIITGFRFALGGAQELFGVMPDLACFGKGMGNGYAISAVVGRADVMRQMEEIFFSFTAGGETVGLAAALATIEKIRSHKVVDHLWRVGGNVCTALQSKLADHGLTEAMAPVGKPPWLLLNYKDIGDNSSWQVKTLFMQEMLERGILIQGAHNFSYAHKDEDIAALTATYDEVLPVIADAVHNGTMMHRLKGPVMQPLFQVR
ncbi:MAG: aminotransferase class III [Alphaproteobacteria bacterium RIFOXYD12_FULL_60_8]|nr:MAG: aminotransferase class III [Alphaproteobacteria bacterium RIFOXYD12_FULL_60_8]